MPLPHFVVPRKASSSLLAQEASQEASGPSRHLWLGNLLPRLTRTAVRAAFEVFGELEDVVTFPGRMYAFVNYTVVDSAIAAVNFMDGQPVRRPLAFPCPDANATIITVVHMP